MAELRIKIKVAELIKAIENRKTEKMEEHKAAISARPGLIKQWQHESEKILATAQAEVAAGRKPKVRSYYGIELPEYPAETETLNLRAYDADLATLRMAADEEISITASDYSRYVR